MAWFLHHPDLSPRLTRWLQFFGQFDFTLEHKAGHLNVVADALSGPPVAIDGLVFNKLYALRLERLIVASNAWFEEGMHNSQHVDKKYVYEDELVKLKCDAAIAPILLPVNGSVILRVLHDHHDSTVSAHPGITRTYLAIRQWFVWKGMRHHVEQYALTCECCVRSKSNTRACQVLLQPLPVPDYCWQHITMYYVTGLPNCRDFNAVLVIVDRLSKLPCYMPHMKDVIAEGSAHLFFNQVVRYYGLPTCILSDQDPKFCSEFWRSLMTCIGVKLKMTVSKRAQADGQSERPDQTLEDALRCTVFHYGDDWADVIATVEYAHSTAIHSLTKVSPFQLDTGRLPTAVILITHIPVGPHAEFAKTREDLIRSAKVHLAQAQERQAKYYNLRRKNKEYSAGD
ncbi:Retrotransposable element [Phytophthora megakarya]|uniref:Retrotransposable element n=1 Tax=Phytophthora megakarya TaxID=4795 RepID=A0A225VE50_9STRA|nr:Retrotransposable element [Phytophthora megakarya]